jgi:YihY family inner membrane protein
MSRFERELGPGGSSSRPGERATARSPGTGRFAAGLNALDRYQRLHAWLGFPLAVRRKYADDQGGYLAATISYYAFFSIFPVLLVFTTLLGYVLRGHHRLYRSIVDSALAQLPVIGHDLQVNSLHGSALALALGLGSALWAGTGVFLAAQNAMNQLWGVPQTRRPDFVRARARALLLLLVLGGGVLATTLLGGLAAFGTGYGFGWKIASIGLSTTLNLGLFWVAFRVLTVGDLTWKELRGGAICAAILYELLQTLGGYYVGHVIKGAGNTYGTFALVIGLLSWTYLAAHITLIAAEVNVVATRRLWPRSLSRTVEGPEEPEEPPPASRGTRSNPR